MNDIEKKVYSREVIEFTAIANEYCNFVENTSEYNGLQILKYLQRILPLLYSKVLAMPKFESLIVEVAEQAVSEIEWQIIHDSILSALGQADDYMEVFDEQIEFSEVGICSSISENTADIYQDLKNCIEPYRIGTYELMNEAIWACKESFNLYWGQKLVNSLRAIHNALKSPEKVGNKAQMPPSSSLEDSNSDDYPFAQRNTDSNTYNE